jgi:hypothetical protein
LVWRAGKISECSALRRHEVASPFGSARARDVENVALACDLSPQFIDVVLGSLPPPPNGGEASTGRGAVCISYAGGLLVQDCEKSSRARSQTRRAFSRRGHDWTDRVPLIAEALARLPGKKSVTLDG